MARASRILLLLTCLMAVLAVHAQDDIPYYGPGPDWVPPLQAYVVASDLPNAVNYLPAPPDTASAAFISDMIKWQWGKSIRQNANGTRTTRGSQAWNDSQYGYPRWYNVLATIFRVTLNKFPGMGGFVYNVGEAGSVSTQYAKLYHKRRRPIPQLNDTTWGRYDEYDDMLTSYSFPSSHTAFGWAVALAIAEMVPELADTTLARAYSYGENRTIVGAHWNSDVENAILTASAAVAHLHTIDAFKQGFNNAQQGYYNYYGKEPPTDTPLPNGRRIQGYSMVDTASSYYYADVAQYWEAKSLRDTDRGLEAQVDASDSERALLQMYSEILGKPLVISTNPGIVHLVRAAREAIIESAQQMRDAAPFKKRPYVQLGEPTLLPGEEAYYADKSSYPSTKAMLGWGLSLLLAEVAPEHNEALLKRGYDYGQSRVIAGYNYPSDVMAGRIQACAVIAHLHSKPEFKDMIDDAIMEYNDDLRLVTQVNDINAHKPAPDRWYTTTGVLLTSPPETPGIYIHNGHKVVVRIGDR